MILTPKKFKSILKEYYSNYHIAKFCLAIDFDNTLCYSHYPYCGDETPLCQFIRAIQEDMDNDFVTIITSCRHTIDSVDMAKEWLQEHNIRWDYFNENDPVRIEAYTDCRKIFSNILIDDTSWGFDMNDYKINEE